MRDEPFIVQVVFDDHDSYYTLTKAQIQTIMAEPDLQKRDDLLVELGCNTYATISSSADVDLVIVLDSQPAAERWDDFVDQLAEQNFDQGS